MEMLNSSHKDMQRTVQVTSVQVWGTCYKLILVLCWGNLSPFFQGEVIANLLFPEVAEVKVQECIYSQALRCGQPTNWQLCFKFQSGQMAVGLG